MQACKCSTCNTIIVNNRFKCASCQNFNLCKACYRCVMLWHPLYLSMHNHAFSSAKCMKYIRHMHSCSFQTNLFAPAASPHLNLHYPSIPVMRYVCPLHPPGVILSDVIPAMTHPGVKCAQ